MSSFMLSCESTADRTAAFFAEHDIAYICFHYEVDGKTYLDDLYQSTTSEQFFCEHRGGCPAQDLSGGCGRVHRFLGAVSQRRERRAARLALLGHFWNI